MSKPRSDRMQRVAEIAGYHTDQAATVVAQCLHELEAARAQLCELEQFRHDYARRQDVATSAGDLLNRQRFVARIDAAIAQQRDEIEHKSQQLAAARAGWIESRSRSSALDTVTDRYRRREQAGAERAEQAVADERAQRPGHPWGRPVT